VLFGEGGKAVALRRQSFKDGRDGRQWLVQGALLEALFLIERPGAVVVKNGFLEEGIVEDIDHFAVAADARDAQRGPDIFPGDKFHRLAVFGENGGGAQSSRPIVVDGMRVIDDIFAPAEMGMAHYETSVICLGCSQRWLNRRGKL